MTILLSGLVIVRGDDVNATRSIHLKESDRSDGGSGFCSISVWSRPIAY